MSEKVDNTLAHFGVLGMRWGRHNSNEPTRKAIRERVKIIKKNKIVEDIDVIIRSQKKMERYPKLSQKTAISLVKGEQFTKGLLKTTAQGLVLGTIVIGGAAALGKMTGSTAQVPFTPTGLAKTVFTGRNIALLTLSAVGAQSINSLIYNDATNTALRQVARAELIKETKN